MKIRNIAVGIIVVGVIFADGVCRLFTRHGRWNGLDGPDEVPEDPCQLELAL